MTPPRLHVLTALASPMAVVLRRGPVNRVASLGWNRDTGAVTLGQWLAGRIYEHRCDLSPDGHHMVYFATKQSRPTGHTGWTALSRAPWLRAIHFAPQTGTWGGGGAFTAQGRVWPPALCPLELAAEGLKPADPAAFPYSTDGIFQGGTHGATLILRGWRHLGGASLDARFARDLPGGGVVEMSYALQRHNRAILSNQYHLTLPGQDRIATDWEWADLWAGRLQFAAHGALWQADLGPEGQMHGTRQIHDFSKLTFQPVPAPYEGIE